MNTRAHLNKVRVARSKRASAKLIGTKERPRLSVFRSNRSVYAQLIDDTIHKTIVQASSREVKESGKKSKSEIAKMVGALVGKRAKDLGVSKAVFDRRSYSYHGRVRAVAEGARESGLAI